MVSNNGEVKNLAKLGNANKRNFSGQYLASTDASLETQIPQIRLNNFRYRNLSGQYLASYDASSDT